MKAGFKQLAVLALLASGSVSAQDLGRPLTWEDCVALSLQRSPDLASALRALEAGRATFYGSFNGLAPQLTLSNSYGDSNSSNGSTRWAAQGTASLNIFNMGQVASIKSASAGVSQAEASLRSASAGVRFNLRQAFAALLFADKSVGVSRNILEMRRRDSQLVTLRYNSGRESKGNMLRAKAQVLQAEADLAQALRNVRTAQITLDRQLGLDDFSEVKATGTLDTAAPPDSPKNFVGLLAQRPDVALQQAVIKTALAAVSQSWSSAWPSVSANYTRSRLGMSELPSAQYNWTFTGQLSYPLFGAGPTATYFSVKSARRSLEKAEQDLRAVRDSAVTDLQGNWAAFAGAVDQVRVQAALLEASRQRNDEADVRYASGLLTFDNWEIIASDRINTEHQAISAQLNAVNAEAAWLKSLGKGLGE